MKCIVNYNVQKDYLERCDDKQPIINCVMRDIDRRLSEKLMSILKENDVLIVTNPQPSIINHNEIFSIEYREEMDIKKLIHCKDCKFSVEVGPGLFLCHNPDIIIVGNYVAPDWYCANGKEKNR